MRVPLIGGFWGHRPNQAVAWAGTAGRKRPVGPPVNRGGMPRRLLCCRSPRA